MKKLATILSAYVLCAAHAFGATADYVVTVQVGTTGPFPPACCGPALQGYEDVINVASDLFAGADYKNPTDLSGNPVGPPTYTVPGFFCPAIQVFSCTGDIAASTPFTFTGILTLDDVANTIAMNLSAPAIERSRTEEIFLGFPFPPQALQLEFGAEDAAREPPIIAQPWTKFVTFDDAVHTTVDIGGTSSSARGRSTDMSSQVCTGFFIGCPTLNDVQPTTRQSWYDGNAFHATLPNRLSELTAIKNSTAGGMNGDTDVVLNTVGQTISGSGHYVANRGDPITLQCFVCDGSDTTIFQSVFGVNVGGGTFSVSGLRQFTVQSEAKAKRDAPNHVQVGKNKFSVAIATTDEFDATMVDVSTLVVGDAATEVHEKSHIKDIFGDLRVDWTGHFSSVAAGIVCGAQDLTLSGATVDGALIAGSVSVVGIGNPCD